MTTIEIEQKLEAKLADMIAKKEQENTKTIWSDSNGRIVCVTLGCAGNRMFWAIPNDLSHDEDGLGGYRMNADERADLRLFCVTNKIATTCECGKVEL